ncbi:hypothetical protein YC2023_051143 [Brassica napus]
MGRSPCNLGDDSVLKEPTDSILINLMNITPCKSRQRENIPKKLLGDKSAIGVLRDINQIRAPNARGEDISRMNVLMVKSLLKKSLICFSNTESEGEEEDTKDLLLNFVALVGSEKAGSD